MARYNNTFEGGTNGTAVSTSNSAGTSGSAWDAIVANGVAVASSPNIIYSTAAAHSGALGCRITLDAGATYLRKDAEMTLDGRVFFRAKFTYPGLPAATATLGVVMAGTVRAVSLYMGTDGKPFFALTNSGTFFTAPKPTNALTPGAKYTFEVIVGKASVAGATDGELGLRILDNSGAVIHTWTGTGNTGVADYTAARFGSLTTASGWTTLDMDDTSFGDLASGWPGPISAPTTTVVSAEDVYYVADFRGSTSAGGNTLAYSIAWTSGPNNSAGIVETIEGLFLIPQDASSSIYTVTVTDGGTTSTRQVNVPASTGTGSAVDSVVEYIWNGSAWV